jgi:hypothetical protein
MTAYPSGYDSFPAHGALMSDTPTHDDSHILLEEAVAALQAALGLSPASSAATVAARIGRLDQVVADRTAVLAISSPAIGQRVWEEAADRLWLRYNSTTWAILGGSMPRASYTETGTITHGSGSNNAWLAHAISGWDAVVDTDGFRSGSNLVIPTGMGGDYQLSLSANGPDQVTASGRLAGVRALITSNTSATNELGNVGVLALHAGGFGRQAVSHLVRLEAGATIQFQTFYFHNATAVNALFDTAKIDLHMVSHIPTLT